MVVAGPGTGKTTVLVMRIASILARTDTAPENILALTFTESGVISMRKALVGIIGSDAHKVKISTFHGFCNSLINDFPEYFPTVVGAKHISDSRKIAIIENILSEGKFTYIKPSGSPFHYVREIVKSLSSLKREGIEPDSFSDIVFEEERMFEKRDDLYHTKGKFAGAMKGEHLKNKRNIEKNKELSTVFKKYQESLKESRLYDYEDMILEAVKKLEDDKEFSMIIQEENHYILADEHQDVNAAQNRVIKELSSFHKNPNVFIVGDEKQAIFRFQGASLDNFMYFKNLYDDIKVIYLTGNYRSQQTILDVSQKLIEEGTSFDINVHKPLEALSGRKKKALDLLEAESTEEESVVVAEKILDLIEKGVSPEEIAVIYREHKDVKPFSLMLEKLGVPFVVRSDKDILGDVHIKKVIKLIEVTCDPADDEKVFRALHTGIAGVNIIDVFRMSRYAAFNKVSLSFLLEKESNIKKAGVFDYRSLRDAYKLIKNWSGEAIDGDSRRVLEKIIYESGIFDGVLASPQSAVALNKMKSFFKEADRLAEESGESVLSNFAGHLSTVESYGLSFGVFEGKFANRVELMTAHASKGREFDYVFIVNAVDKKWGNKRSMDLFRLPSALSALSRGGDNEDERRLFYVSLTRARESVFVSLSGFRNDGREQMPSVFITDMNKTDLVKKAKRKLMKELDEKAVAKLLFTPAPSTGPSIAEKDHIVRIFLDQSLSVTALNAYFKCPWKYFYVNLVRIPRTYSLSQRFGIAIHDSLKEFFNRYRDEGDPGKNFLFESFKDSLSRQSIPDADEQVLLERGERALMGYHEKYAGTWKRDIETEKNVVDVLLEFDFLPKPLSIVGKLDKIEGAGSRVVIDYKTGEPKSRGFIEGKTKNSDGEIKRQLVFYKLLVDSSFDLMGEMTEGVIDFIEPNKAGKHKKESFFISEEEVEDLKGLIAQMAEEVYRLSFWDKDCGDPKCKFCLMRKELNSGVII